MYQEKRDVFRLLKEILLVLVIWIIIIGKYEKRVGWTSWSISSINRLTRTQWKLPAVRRTNHFSAEQPFLNSAGMKARVNKSTNVATKFKIVVQVFLLGFHYCCLRSFQKNWIADWKRMDTWMFCVKIYFPSV